MKVVIYIPEERYKDIQNMASVQLENYNFKMVKDAAKSSIINKID